MNDEITIDGIVYVKKIGNKSTGDWSTGNGSTGNGSTGHWSISDWSTGHFDTKPRKLRAFNKKVDPDVWNSAFKPSCLFFDLTKWIDDKEMTDAEKSENPNYITTGGYLKVFDYKEAFTKSVKNATKEERDQIRALPNFDDDVFLEVSGCDLRLLDL